MLCGIDSNRAEAKSHLGSSMWPWEATVTLSDPPPLTVLKPGEGRERPLGSIGVVFKLWGSQTNGSVSIVEHPFRLVLWCQCTCTPARTSTRSSLRARSGLDPAIARSYWDRAGISPSHAGRCTRCGTLALCRHG